MDFNELLNQYQIAVMNQKHSRSAEDRETYLNLVEYYSKRIRKFRADVVSSRAALNKAHKA